MSPSEPMRLSGAAVDLSPRVARSGAVAASPAAATETTVCTLTVRQDIPLGLGIVLFGYAAFTVGTDGVSVVTRIRQTDTSGTIVKASGALTVVAAQLHDSAIIGTDLSPVLPGQVYVLTLTVASASAGSTVSAAELVAVLI